ncbi:MAG: AbrB/MazE/SpoVT family DNA-binding domain-containing protein [Acutalibacteraceae bacterium]|nr:AbrB/MazE/SpoVT family DNA-binding domain-containing protein [Acutalibacteraceae bacterium]
MNKKIVRVLGKRGRITIPYEIRVRNKIGYNDILSFEEQDKNTIIVRKEKLCGGCTPECFDEGENISIKDFLDSLSPAQQHEATVYLNLLWAQKEGVKTSG